MIMFYSDTVHAQDANIMHAHVHANVMYAPAVHTTCIVHATHNGVLCGVKWQWLL